VSMRTATLGRLEISAIGLGCNNFGRGLDQSGADAVVHAALDAGITFFDTSSNYGGGQSEALLAHALGSRRDDVVIATKFGVPVTDADDGGAAPDYVRRMLERSLRQLSTDRIDLYQLHKPDPATPIAATLEVLADAVRQGTVREIACSNLSAEQWAEALRVSDASGFPRFLANQVEYSLVHREPETDGLVDLCRAEGLALFPYYPLASGLLTGKLRKGEAPTGRLKMERYQGFLTERNFALVEGLRSFAAARGLTPVHVALGWLLAQPVVPSVPAGAMTPEQVRANAAVADWSPSADDLAELDRLLEADAPLDTR
jgi:aryl-alcohol dehydrogenase-like predicted oxidoreductase